MRALVKNLFTYRHLIYILVVREISGQYRQSALGTLWKVAQPIGMTLLFILINLVIPLSQENVPYPLYVFAAMVPWTFFTSAFVTGSDSIIANSDLIKKIYFPREILIIQAFGSALLDFFIAFGFWLILKLIYHSPFSWVLIFLPLILAIQVTFTLGLSFLVASFNFIRRDINHLRGLLLQIWFYFTPIVYSPKVIPQNVHTIYYLNPMVGLTQSYRSIFISGQPPDFFLLIWPTLLSIGVMFIGYKFFKRMEPLMADIV